MRQFRAAQQVSVSYPQSAWRPDAPDKYSSFRTLYDNAVDGPSYAKLASTGLSTGVR